MRPPSKQVYTLALATVLFAGGVAMAGRPAWRLGCRMVLRRHAEHTWKAAVLNPQRKPGQAAAWLRIPACAVDSMVLLGDSPKSLHRFPCQVDHIRIPVITGHRDSHFRGLRHLAPGVALTYQPVEAPSPRHYTVVETEILRPERVAVRLREKRGDWLALVTCHPFRYVGPAPRRFVGWARPTRREGGLPYPTDNPSSPDRSSVLGIQAEEIDADDGSLPRGRAEIPRLRSG